MIYRLYKFADSTPGLEQYALKKYAESFESIAKILSDNCGLDATEMISNLVAGHATGNAHIGIDIEVCFYGFRFGMCDPIMYLIHISDRRS